MSVTLEIPFQTLKELVKQLPQEEKERLVREIAADEPQQPRADLTPAEKMARLRQAMSNAEFIRDFPISREEMYDDDR